MQASWPVNSLKQYLNSFKHIYNNGDNWPIGEVDGAMALESKVRDMIKVFQELSDFPFASAS